ncbi:2288_t:CDS:2 [Ambispora leptoticha]|uniref:2288_t:CDS:1 n=1 Tax=Ambispora leptoticha TaxID=144679 RepID=A0A9N9GCX1_9GLOM|nr:2288_t:CDS:2 [Ambispora leptoticha]
MSRARRLAGLPPPADSIGETHIKATVLKEDEKAKVKSHTRTRPQKVYVPKVANSMTSPTPSLLSKSLFGINKKEENNSESLKIPQEVIKRGFRKPVKEVKVTPFPPFELKQAGIEKRLPPIIGKDQEVIQPVDPEVLKVVILGTPNSGKSTLLNGLIGETVSVVSDKAHTTRERILAIFLDTPGVVAGHNHIRMNRHLLNASWHSIREADHLLVLVDAYRAAHRSTFTENWMFDRLNEYQLPATLILNKIDLLSNKNVIPRLNETYSRIYSHIVDKIAISALNNYNLIALKELLFSKTRPHKWLYAPEQKVEMGELKRVEEFIRVEFFKRLKSYLPYMLTQENLGWTELNDGTLRIDQIIYVEKNTQEKIIIGKQGSIISEVALRAQEEISRALKRSVKLFFDCSYKTTIPSINLKIF